MGVRTGASYVRHGETGLMVDRLPPGAACVSSNADAMDLAAYLEAIDEAQRIDRTEVRKLATDEFSTTGVVDRLVEVLGSLVNRSRG